MSKELALKEHFHLGVVGRTGSGKTEWLIRFMKDRQGSSAMILCSEKSILTWKNAGLECVFLITSDPKDVLPVVAQAEKYKNKKKLTPQQMPIMYLIFDDFMPTLRHCNLEKDFEEIAKVGRHIGIRIIGLTQDAKDFPKYLRTQLTHVAMMHNTDSETFDQLIETMKLQEYNKKLWTQLKQSEDFTMMLLEKGNDVPQMEKYDRATNEIINCTKVNIVGDSNTVNQTVLNLNGQASFEQRINEIKQNACIMKYEAKNTEFRDAINRVQNIHKVLCGVFYNAKTLATVKDDIIWLSSYLGVVVPCCTDDNWMDNAVAVLTYYKFEDLKSDSSLTKLQKKEQLIEYSTGLKRNASYRKKNLHNDTMVSLAVTGEMDKVLVKTIAHKLNIESVGDVSIEQAYDMSKAAVPMLETVGTVIRWFR